MSSAFRFLDGKSLETVRRILQELNTYEASVTIEDVICTLGTEKGVKLSRDELEVTTEEVRQMVLMEDRKTYKAQT